MNNVLDKSNDFCTGCSICVKTCSKNAIYIQLNELGFYVPKINDNLCVDCGLCKKNCVKFCEGINTTDTNYKCYAVVNKDAEIVEKSSSGGISDALAKYAIGNGYKVIGTAYDYEDNIAKGIIIDDISDLYKIRGSKYFQSKFDEVVKQIDKTQKYLVLGTPCQIYGIHTWATNNKIIDNFVLVDLFCHGVASVKLWSNYIRSECNEQKFDKVEFRSKARGWHQYCSKFYIGKETITTKDLDEFYELFLSRYCSNKACEKCNIKASFQYSDIRLGDFWGKRYFENKQGVSSVVACTDKGNDFLLQNQNISILERVSFDEVITEQSCRKELSLDINNRELIMSSLADGESIKLTHKKYISTLTFKQKIKRKLKKIAKKLPRKVQAKIKYIKE